MKFAVYFVEIKKEKEKTDFDHKKIKIKNFPRS